MARDAESWPHRLSPCTGISTGMSQQSPGMAVPMSTHDAVDESMGAVVLVHAGIYFIPLVTLTPGVQGQSSPKPIPSLV